MGLLLILVGIGGGLGAMSRFALTQATASISKQIPIGILLCNIIGSLIIGMMAAFLIQTKLFNEDISTYVRSLFVTGFLGGFTTFSSFSLDILNLLQRGEALLAISYILVSVIVSLIAVILGFYFIMGIYR
ncbi:fluoride efflux transporter CrcB [Francisella noatunensis]|uniref:Fluoride-specific ion channel FluC n=3 Tax=Francisella TaxID=262 RepID=FLUC_FRAP2|nr:MULTISPECIES: fluoride efflux transporter CrcB [Francisella]B0TW03.1 RecName: Full=Fluoride-specific ion channel FluC [Francisella philomiragia subsp. philomiragia ATCC 25017]AJI46923.1 crcB-like family protein [Francisella philomiragia]AJI48542.1 crcB-like family protein [Francisella philomiragia]AJI54654.1 crcB-like family protein [Francisella philomiragia]AJI56183.1 crcB-like family protein [Francisella philomiragia]KFJ42760.1 crcB-like family protein [Francisella philomiragia]